MSGQAMGDNSKAAGDRRLLFVGNLPWVLDSYGLRKLFEPFGEVLSSQISHDDQNDRSLGYGHVLFADEKCALKAIQEMDRRDLGGRSISVHFPRKHSRVTAADNFEWTADDNRAQGGYRRGGMGGRNVDARAMRFNPGAVGGSRYAQPVSQEKLAYQYARDFMDSNFLLKLQDPRYQLGEEAWLDYPIEDDDDDYDWQDYKLSWLEWDPVNQALVTGGRLEDMRPAGQENKPIDWDNDFCADPLQMLPDGREHFIADPRREVAEDFDQVFFDNDERKLEELERISRDIGVGGVVPSHVLDDLKPANRPKDSSEGLGRRAGKDKAHTNVVDPWGKRRPRFGVRQKAANSKAILERMQQRDDLVQATLAEIQYDLTGEGERPEKWRPEFEHKETSGGWAVVKRNTPAADSASRPSTDGGSGGGSGAGGAQMGDWQGRKDPDRPGYVQIRKFDTAKTGDSPYANFRQRQKAVRAFSQDEQASSKARGSSPQPGPQAKADVEGQNVSLDKLTVVALKAKLKERGLPVSGTKAVLLQRLKDNAAGQ